MISNIYTDGVHLMSADEVALHAFASGIGLRREWFQDNEKHPHYDLTTTHKAGQAVASGAVAVGSSKVLLMLVERDARIRDAKKAIRLFLQTNGATLWCLNNVEGLRQISSNG